MLNNSKKHTYLLYEEDLKSLNDSIKYVKKLDIFNKNNKTKKDKKDKKVA